MGIINKAGIIGILQGQKDDVYCYLALPALSKAPSPKNRLISPKGTLAYQPQFSPFHVIILMAL